MKKYEGLFIFSDSLKDEDLQKIKDKLCDEITKVKGVVHNIDMMGRLEFARPFKKHSAGYYMRIDFSMEPGGISGLQAKIRLNQDVLRVQVVCASKIVSVKRDNKRTEQVLKTEPEVGYGGSR